MQVILDHLTAVIVSSVLLFIFALLQLRGMSSTTESNVNYMVRSETLGIAHMIEQDIENMRTETQTDAAIAAGIFTGGGAYTCSVTQTADNTTQFTFPTLSDPQTSTSLSNPTSAPVVLVTYALIDTGDTIPLKEGGTTQNLPLYRLERQINGTSTGGSRGYVVDFDIELLSSGSSTPIVTSTTCPSDMKKVRFQLKMATEAVTHVAHDQESLSQLNFSRYGNTIDLINWQ